MCELFGISSAKKYHSNKYLKAFFSHSVRHPHGWGLACVSGCCHHTEKESVQACRSNYLKERLSQPICAQIVLAHIRYATIGNVEYRNCHPFTGKDNSGSCWTMIHNGTIFDYPPINSYIRRQCGDTDSERVFLYFLDRISEAQKQKGAKLSFDEKFDLFDEIVADMSKGNKLNLMLTDGRYIFTHSNCRNTLYYHEENGAAVISTTPLNNDEWKLVPFLRASAFHNGKLVRTGTLHENEYIENEEAMKMLYSIFANL